MPTVLVIDDEAQVREVLDQALEREGYTVLQAADGREGLRLFRAHLPDLVISDIVMPEEDGLGTLRAIRRMWPRAPVVVISGATRILDMDVFQAAELLGACRTFAKPLDLREVLRAVREIVPLGPQPAA